MTAPGEYHRILEQIDALRHGPAQAAASPAWRVYANTGLLACQEALAANYPGLQGLLGEQQFGELAAVYVRAFPADDARLFLYGASLPAALCEHDGKDSLAALAAMLDRCWTEAHAEADAAPLQLDWLMQQAPDDFSSLHLRPAPATRWLAHASLPALRWWDTPRHGAGEQAEIGAQARAVLITRPDDAVIVQALPLAGVRFLQACEADLSVPAALEAAAAVTPAAHLHELLAMLFGAGALQHPDRYVARALSCTSSVAATIAFTS